MNLNTHFLFAAAVAAFLTGKPEAIMLAAIGAIIPDLDRPYWFIPKKRTEKEEYHRAFLHNIVALAIVYIINPYLGLGLFSHLLLDSMTTVKDRGVEWLFPFTRSISEDYWSQAEVQKEPLAWIPWRRTYGPALNGHMLDTYVSICSIGVLVSWIILQNLNHSIIKLNYWLNLGFVMLSGSVILLFASGEYATVSSSWSRSKKITVITILILTLAGWATTGLISQNNFFTWEKIQNDLLLKNNALLNRIFILSVTIYSIVLLKYIRKISLFISDHIPVFCTKMPSRDFFIDEKENIPDVFV